MHIENILVPVDFSAPSRLALNYGIALARKFRAKLSLLHVMERSATLAGFPPGTAAIEKEHRQQTLRMLSALVAPEDQDDLDLRIILKSGDIEDEISSTIAGQRADMLVMGTHGRGLFGRWLIGSVTQSVLRKLPIPILTVCRVTRPLTIKRILFAADLSESSKHAFRFVLELAQEMGATVVVLHAVEPVSLSYAGSEMMSYVSDENIADAQAKLAGYVAEGAQQKVKVQTVMVQGCAAKEILKAADENEIDLILIAVQGKGLIERAFLGTTAEQVIREAHVPVLSVPVDVGVVQEQMTGLNSAKS